MEKIQQASVLVYLWDVTAMTLAEVHADLERLTVDGGQPTVDGRRLTVDGGRRTVDGDAPVATELAEPNDSVVPRPASTVYRLLVVCNKMDKNPYFKTEWLVDPAVPNVYPYLQSDPPAQNRIGLTPEQIVPISAKNEQNIEYLKEQLFAIAIGEDIRQENTVVTNVRHYDALQRTDEALNDVLTGLDTGITGDFVAMDIRRALNFLGEITGEIGVEDLLGNIFGRFCIGK